ncbi:MAG: helix-turn-helix domain-containing protein [Boseongicola sp.]|nr:helix-turn-helix domain-containing protein [Boseongicola sp.]
MAKDQNAPERKYTAPALEKGLDIVEFLAKANAPRTVAEISTGLERSRGELFRMLSVLQHRGVIDKSHTGDAYTITDKLFSLRLKRSFATQITTVAVPEMQQFCAESGQSCHLALRSNFEIVVIVRVEHPENLNLSVPVGHRRQIYDSPSGRCILAFADESLRRDVLAAWSAPKAEKAKLLTQLDKIQADGYAKISDGFVVGITGISAPIIRQVDQKCDFALTTTVFDKMMASTPSQQDIAASIRKTAHTISEKYYIS